MTSRFHIIEEYGLGTWLRLQAAGQEMQMTEFFRGPLRDFACIDTLLGLRQATSSAGGFDFVLLDNSPCG